MSLTLAEVRQAGRVAYWQCDRGAYVEEATYLPNNLPDQRVRLCGRNARGGHVGSIMFGPGSDEHMPDGWTHDQVCTCEFAPRCRG